jgi:hypothetical protein
MPSSPHVPLVNTKSGGAQRRAGPAAAAPGRHTIPGQPPATPRPGPGPGGRPARAPAPPQPPQEPTRHTRLNKAARESLRHGWPWARPPRRPCPAHLSGRANLAVDVPHYVAADAAHPPPPPQTSPPPLLLFRRFPADYAACSRGCRAAMVAATKVCCLLPCRRLRRAQSRAPQHELLSNANCLARTTPPPHNELLTANSSAPTSARFRQHELLLLSTGSSSARFHLLSTGSSTRAPERELLLLLSARSSSSSARVALVGRDGRGQPRLLHDPQHTPSHTDHTSTHQHNTRTTPRTRHTSAATSRHPRQESDESQAAVGHRSRSRWRLHWRSAAMAAHTSAGTGLKPIRI